MNDTKALRMNRRPSRINQILPLIHPQLTKWFDKDYEIFKKLFDDIAGVVRPYITNHKASLDSNQPR